jgi:hypothetical protein
MQHGDQLAEGHSVDHLFAHCGLSERAAVHCKELGLTIVLEVRKVLQDPEQAACMDRNVREELTALLEHHGVALAPPPRKRQVVCDHAGFPAEQRALAESGTVTDVRFYLQHLSARSRNAVIRHLLPTVNMAELDAFVFGNYEMGKLRSVGALSAVELYHWRKEMRAIRTAAKSTVQEGPV